MNSLFSCSPVKNSDIFLSGLVPCLLSVNAVPIHPWLLFLGGYPCEQLQTLLLLIIGVKW